MSAGSQVFALLLCFEGFDANLAHDAACIPFDACWRDISYLHGQGRELLASIYSLKASQARFPRRWCHYLRTLYTIYGSRVKLLELAEWNHEKDIHVEITVWWRRASITWELVHKFSIPGPSMDAAWTEWPEWRPRWASAAAQVQAMELTPWVPSNFAVFWWLFLWPIDMNSIDNQLRTNDNLAISDSLFTVQRSSAHSARWWCLIKCV